MSEKPIAKMGQELLRIYALESETGRFIGVSVASPMPAKDVIMILRTSLEQMEQTPAPASSPIGDIDIGEDFAGHTTKEFKYKAEALKREAKLELKNGQHTKIIVWEQNGIINAFPIDNVELALKEGTKETLERLKRMGL